MSSCTNSSLSKRLTLALTSDAGDLDSASEECAFRALSQKPNPSLCFQTSVLTLLAHNPSRLAILEPQRSTLPVHQKKKVPYEAAQKPQMRINLRGLDRTPIS